MISSSNGKQSNFKRPMANKVTSKELQKKDRYVFVDVREADELEKGKIDGALHMPG
ncbi:MAG: rhodanese-like domain-containing protein [Candidatus Nitrosopolaris sp.]